MIKYVDVENYCHNGIFENYYNCKLTFGKIYKNNYIKLRLTIDENDFNVVALMFCDVCLFQRKKKSMTTVLSKISKKKKPYCCHFL